LNDREKLLSNFDDGIGFRIEVDLSQSVTNVDKSPSLKVTISVQFI